MAANFFDDRSTQYNPVGKEVHLPYAPKEEVESCADLKLERDKLKALIEQKRNMTGPLS